MVTFVVRRLLISLVVLFFVTIIGFSIMHLLPGDPVTSILGETASPHAPRQTNYVFATGLQTEPLNLAAVAIL